MSPVSGTGDQRAVAQLDRLLVVEVLSANRADLVLKTGRYAAAGAPHYWIIDPRDRCIDAYDLGGGLYHRAAHVEEDAVVRIPFGTSALEVDLRSLLG